MDFEFTAEQVAIRDTIRELVQDRVAPRAAEIDQTAEYPKDIEKLFAESGILGIPFPEEYGGISGSSVTICMGIEEIAKACASSSLILAVQALGIRADQRERRSPRHRGLCPRARDKSLESGKARAQARHPRLAYRADRP